MTRPEALPIARRLAAAVCESTGCTEAFCDFMRQGAYDDHREVLSAQAGIMEGFRLAQSIAADQEEAA